MCSKRGRVATSVRTLLVLATGFAGTASFASTQHAAGHPALAAAPLAAVATAQARPADTRTLPWARDELLEPRLLQSDRGTLDVLMVAHEAPVAMFSPFVTNGWVYEICPRPANGKNRCPRGTSTSNEYGGTRLQVEPGDTLKVRLVNKLPIFTLPIDPDAAVNPGARGRSQNPTSLHTHGLLVSPHEPYPGETTWGDNSFVRVFNLENGHAPDFEKLMGPVLYNFIDYAIELPATHPSGLFWFHPHAHGLTQPQITSGLSGVLTVGHVADEICTTAECKAAVAQVPQRHLLLKDTQIESDGTLLRDQDTGFCAVDDTPGSTSRSHEGGCDGTVSSPVSGIDHTGGRWFYSINGQVFPTLTVGMPTGQIWRITNSASNTTYDLNLWLPSEGRQMQMEVLSVDGISVGTGKANVSNPQTCRSPLGGTFGVCTQRLHIMPAARVEIWIAYRDAQGAIGSSPRPVEAVLRTSGYATGPTGDNFPAIDMAKVLIDNGQVAMTGDGTTSPRTAAHTAAMPAMPMPASHAMAMPRMAMAHAGHARMDDTHCAPLAPGHVRRIFLNVPKDNPNGFGLGFEEVDANGATVPGSFVDVRTFDHMDAPICLSLKPGNKATSETWQLVNLAGEDHSFHVHQVRFAVVSAPTVDGTTTPTRVALRKAMVDSLPLPHADGFCASVDDWKRGACHAHVATIQIPFGIPGDFLYHCHVLEHEDGGMMAAIRVLPNP